MRRFPPERIVCLTEETVETFYLLGEVDRIVGVSGYAVRPARVRREKPWVSAFATADIPKILALAAGALRSATRGGSGGYRLRSVGVGNADPAATICNFADARPRIKAHRPVISPEGAEKCAVRVYSSPYSQHSHSDQRRSHGLRQPRLSA